MNIFKMQKKIIIFRIQKNDNKWQQRKYAINEIINGSTSTIYKKMCKIEKSCTIFSTK